MRRAEPGSGAPTPAAFERLNDGSGRQFADPFLFQHAGQTWLFAEEILTTGRGVLACARIEEPAGRVGAFRRLLDDGSHMSYPFVFEHDGQIYLLPETSAKRKLTLYRCTDFPLGWSAQADLLRDIQISDATLLRRGALWWILAAVVENNGSSHDELHAFFSVELVGPWTPHPLNPLKSDARSARPGGRVFERDGRLIRPAQNCERYYGAGLSWCEITTLTPGDFSERVIAQWSGADIGPYVGVHTYDAAGRFEVIDVIEPAALPQLPAFLARLGARQGPDEERRRPRSLS
jgi:hypothetical protein